MITSANKNLSDGTMSCRLLPQMVARVAVQRVATAWAQSSEPTQPTSAQTRLDAHSNASALAASHHPHDRGGVGAPLHAASTDTHAHPHTEIFGANPAVSTH